MKWVHCISFIFIFTNLLQIVMLSYAEGERYILLASIISGLRYTRLSLVASTFFRSQMDQLLVKTG